MEDVHKAKKGVEIVCPTTSVGTRVPSHPIMI